MDILGDNSVLHGTGLRRRRLSSTTTPDSLIVSQIASMANGGLHGGGSGGGGGGNDHGSDTVMINTPMMGSVNMLGSPGINFAHGAPGSATGPGSVGPPSGYGRQRVDSILGTTDAINSGGAFDMDAVLFNGDAPHSINHFLGGSATGGSGGVGDQTAMGTGSSGLGHHHHGTAAIGAGVTKPQGQMLGPPPRSAELKPEASPMSILSLCAASSPKMEPSGAQSTSIDMPRLSL